MIIPYTVINRTFTIQYVIQSQVTVHRLLVYEAYTDMQRVDFRPHKLVESLSVLVIEPDDVSDSPHDIRPIDWLLVRVVALLVHICST